MQRHFSNEMGHAKDQLNIQLPHDSTFLMTEHKAASKIIYYYSDFKEIIDSYQYSILCVKSQMMTKLHRCQTIYDLSWFCGNVQKSLTCMMGL